MPIIHKYVKFELIGERKRKENLALEEKQKIPSKKRKLNKKIINSKPEENTATGVAGWYYCVGKAQDRLKDFGAAFTAYKEANDIVEKTNLISSAHRVLPFFLSKIMAWS